MTYAGFSVSLIGLIGYVIGILTMDRIFVRRWTLIAERQEPRRIRLMPVLIVGIMFSVLFSPLLGGIPSVGAIITAGERLTTISFILGSWYAFNKGNQIAALGWVAFAIIFPIVTTLSGGFIGFGVITFLMIAVFSTSFLKSNWLLLGLAVLVSYLGLSVWVTYSRDRQEIREVVWGNRDFEKRLVRVYSTFKEFEPFNPFEIDHLESLDIRFNKNHEVGRSVEYLSHPYNSYAKGETVGFALISWIPRIVWPNKPMIGGSADLVSRSTGMRVADGTSMGVGQILEFYFNFGKLGVVVGMCFLGCVIRYLDIHAAVCLKEENVVGFILWYLPLLVMIQPAGALSEVISSCVAAGLLSFGLNWYFKHFELRNLQERYIKSG